MKTIQLKIVLAIALTAGIGIIPNLQAGIIPGIIKGTITDCSNGTYLGLATAASTGTSSTSSQTTSSGDYFVQVPPGTYRLKFSKSGYWSKFTSNFQVSSSSTVTKSACLFRR